MKGSGLTTFTMFLKSQNTNAFSRGLCSLVLLPSLQLYYTCRFTQVASSLCYHVSQCVIFKALDTPRTSANLHNP